LPATGFYLIFLKVKHIPMRILLFVLLAFYGCGRAEPDTSLLQNGDLIFQVSLSAQSKAIQLATHSQYSHCGIIYKEGKDYFVFEAIQPVQKTPFAKWVARGEGSHYVVKRLKEADKVLTPATLKKMKNIAQAMAGKNYDLYFEWSNDRIYCSELIWKIYKESTGLEIGQLQQLKDFDLSTPSVKQKLKERYGTAIPTNQKVISPAAIFKSKLLYTVIEK
jgi:uncharacterized protein YycO